MLSEADYSMTEGAFQGEAGRYANDAVLLVKFVKHPRFNPHTSAENERPMYDETDYIQIMQPGNKDSIIFRPATEMDKQRFAEHFKKFNARMDQQASNGTLLEEWPQITRSQVLELQWLNITTVEQLVDVSDSNSQGIMGIGALQSKAVAFLEKNKDVQASEELQQELSERDAKIDALMARLEALEGGGDIEAAPDVEMDISDIGDEEEEEEEVPVKKARRRKQG